MPAASAMKAATKATAPTASSSATHAARETVHTPETGLAAEGVLVCHAAVVESAKCTGTAM